MHTLTVIQARMGSTRLPGKVLADLAGQTMLARVVERVRRARLAGRVVVATSTAAEDTPICRQCDRLAVDHFRGDPTDVLDRFQQAAIAFQAERIVRITSDCPLIDAEVFDRVVGAFLEHAVDYASNVVQRTYPRGLDTEVMTAEALATAWREAREPYQRAHVTPFLYQHPARFRLLDVLAERDLDNFGPGDYERLNQWRWTVDTAADLAFVAAVYQRLGQDGVVFSWRDVCRLLRRHPHLADLNRHVRHKGLVEG